MTKRGRTVRKKKGAVTRVVTAIAFSFFILCLALVLARDLVAKAVIQTFLKGTFGLPVEMGRVDFGIRTTKIQIRDLKVFNPPGFEDTVFLHFPSVSADYSPRDVCVQKKFGLRSLELVISSANVVKNAAGTVNLSKVQRKGQGAFPVSWIDLSIERATYLDLGKSPGTDVKNYEIGLHHFRFENAGNLGQILKAVILKTVEKVSAEEFGINVNQLTQELSGNLKADVR